MRNGPQRSLRRDVYQPELPPHVEDAIQVEAAAQSIGRRLFVLRAGTPDAIDAAFATLMEQRAGALLIGGPEFLPL